VTGMFDSAIKQLRLEEEETWIVWLLCAASRDERHIVRATVAQLGEWGRLHPGEVTRALARLTQLGLLQLVERHGGAATWHVACSSSSELAASSELASSDEQGSTTSVLERRVGREEVRRRETLSCDAPKSPDALMRLWNSIVTALPKVFSLTQSRRRQAIARLTDYPDLDWASVIRRLDASPFCRGDNDRGWRANFDFFLRPNTVTKTLEGVYDGAPTLPISSRNLAASEAWLAARRRARGEHDNP